MNIGIFVEGVAEYRSLPALIPKINSPHRIMSPIKIDIHPLAPLSQIVGAIKRRLPILKNRNAKAVIVLIDREGRAVCPGTWAKEIETSLRTCCSDNGMEFCAVVIKETKFENWLVADTSVFEKMPKRFQFTDQQVLSIQDDKADRINAEVLLKAASIKHAYDKVEDAMRIMRLASPEIIGKNSRSFRRLLRVVKHPTYLTQSLRP